MESVATFGREKRSLRDHARHWSTSMRAMVAVLTASLLFAPLPASAQSTSQPQGNQQPKATSQPTKNKTATTKAGGFKGEHAYMAKSKRTAGRPGRMRHAKRHVRRTFAYRAGVEGT